MGRNLVAFGVIFDRQVSWAAQDSQVGTKAAQRSGMLGSRQAIRYSDMLIGSSYVSFHQVEVHCSQASSKATSAAVHLSLYCNPQTFVCW